MVFPAAVGLETMPVPLKPGLRLIAIWTVGAPILWTDSGWRPPQTLSSERRNKGHALQWTAATSAQGAELLSGMIMRA